MKFLYKYAIFSLVAALILTGCATATFDNFNLMGLP